MKYADIKLARELYDLSGWLTGVVVGDYGPFSSGRKPRAASAPAYDLGYLLRRLPQRTPVGQLQMHHDDDRSHTDGAWLLRYGSGNTRAKLYAREFSPEDAACKLAIELFKQGVLTREGGDAA